MLRLHDTASGQLEPVVFRDRGRFSMYVCGPTVYAPPHVGHGRVTLVYDVLRRYLEYRGVEVAHVSNVTDIDDKIIDRAAREQRPWQEIAGEAEAEWWSTMDAIGALRPTQTPHATAYIDEMVALVDQLLANGSAYRTDDGVYLEVSTVPEYGLLSHQRAEDRMAGARVDVAEHKRAPEDFALWKAAKPGEPKWEAPFGDGRPGWHTECVAMAFRLLGEGFDLHGGGLDLVFPHHENERAQAVALGRPFATRWVHNGLVVRGGQKMSKSIGNTLGLGELVESADPRAYRMLVLAAQYRAPLEVRRDLLEDASRSLARVDAFGRRLAELPSATGAGGDETLRERFTTAMEADLDTPAALAALFEGVRQANALLDRGDVVGGAAIGREVERSFAALGVTSDVRSDADAWAEETVRRRDAARAAHDFALADALRVELEVAGWVVEDTAGGTRIHH